MLDITGFLLSQQFLGRIAGILVVILTGLFSQLIGGFFNGGG